MNKEELIQFLKENLIVNVWVGRDGCGSPEIGVNIVLCDEKICENTDYLDV